MSNEIVNAEVIAGTSVSTADRTRSETAIKKAIRQLKSQCGLSGKRVPVVYSCEFPNVTCPSGPFIFVNDFGNGPRGQYAIEIKRGN